MAGYAESAVTEAPGQSSKNEYKAVYGRTAAQTWNGKGPERAAAVSFWLNSAAQRHLLRLLLDLSAQIFERGQKILSALLILVGDVAYNALGMWVWCMG